MMRGINSLPVISTSSFTSSNHMSFTTTSSLTRDFSSDPMSFTTTTATSALSRDFTDRMSFTTSSLPRDFTISQPPLSSISLPATSQPHLMQHLSSSQPLQSSGFSMSGIGSTLIPSYLQQNQMNLLPQVSTVSTGFTSSYDYSTKNKPWNTNISNVYSTLPTTDYLSTIGSNQLAIGTDRLGIGTGPTTVGTTNLSTIGTGLSTTGTDHILGHDNKIDMLEIPEKGRCYVYIARYSYNPFQQSPNANPEAELAVSAGDYVLVWGNMDEDGFFDGELLDGRRGLVPSNFIQKLENDDLVEFYKSIILGVRNSDDSSSTNISQDFSSMAQNMMTADDMSLPLQTTNVYHKYPEILDDILEEEEESPTEEAMAGGPVPPPRQLTLERQLNKSILIGWNHPTEAAPGSIESYHVYVDGVLKTTVKATERTRALVEGVDSNRPHRISVRSVTPNRRTSRDAACTMVIGKDVPLGPTSVKISHLRSTSAVISWLPSNSNYQHVVCVNNVEVRTVKPGIYRHTITGLAPNTVYHVTIRAKNIRAPHFNEQSAQEAERLSCHIDFRTLPKDIPDPPIDVQVEAGPQDGTILVTWLPVSASGAFITGYTVFADGRKLTDVESPTGDHVLIDMNKLGLHPKQVTVRSKSKDSQSTDSQPIVIPPTIFQKKYSHTQQSSEPLNGRREHEHYDQPAPDRRRPRSMRVDAHGQMVIEPEENLSDKEIYPGGSTSYQTNVSYTENIKGSPNKSTFRRDNRYNVQGAPRSHVERGQPPLPPQERNRIGQYPSQHRDRIDERDNPYIESSGSPRMHRGQAPVDRGYRGSNMPPGRGTSHHPQPYTQTGGNVSSTPARDKRVRHFVALYDYDPSTMSPNMESRDEELAFSEGDKLKVYGEKDSDGFYWGECRGRRGYIPHNMILEVDPPVKSTSTSHGRPPSRERWSDAYSNMPVKKMIAMYDYDPQKSSPNFDAEQVELSFKTGDIIYVYGKMDDDGFYMAELNGERGLVPSNFFADAAPEYDHGQNRQQGFIPHDRNRFEYSDQSPGVRGPTPPPRDVRILDGDRRRDACYPAPPGGSDSIHQGQPKGKGEEWGLWKDGKNNAQNWLVSKISNSQGTSRKLFDSIRNYL